MRNITQREPIPTDFFNPLHNIQLKWKYSLSQNIEVETWDNVRFIQDIVKDH